MEANRSHLLAAARPYLLLFALFTLTPPIRSFEKMSRKSLLAGYACYALVILLITFYECYVNMHALRTELIQFQVVDFSLVMGNTQKIVVPILATVNHLNMLANFRRLEGIYKDIIDLEEQVTKAMEKIKGERSPRNFQIRLALGVGLWSIVFIVLIPYCTLNALGPFVSCPNKLFTEFILVMIQLKGLEYCLFVKVMHELVLRHRHTLEKLQQEMVDCTELDDLRVLCVELRQSQDLAGRIWRLVGELSTYFSVSLMGLFLFNGLTILHVVNWAFIKQANPNDHYSALRLGTCSLLLLNLLIICIHSDSCVRVYNRSIPRILHQLHGVPATDFFPTLSRGLREYTLQMQHLQLHFSICGCFHINLKYFGGVVMTVLGYIVILLQFKIQGVVLKRYKSFFNITEDLDQI